MCCCAIKSLAAEDSSKAAVVVLFLLRVFFCQRLELPANVFDSRDESFPHGAYVGKAVRFDGVGAQQTLLQQVHGFSRIFEGGFLQLVRNERGIVFVHVENVVDPYREGIDVGDDFLKLVGGQAAFGEVVEFKRRVGVAARTLGGGRGDMRGGAGVVYYYW